MARGDGRGSKAEGEALRTSEARHAFLVRLGDVLRAAMDPSEAQAVACRLLREQLEVSRVLYAEVDAADQTVEVRVDHSGPGVLSLVGRHDLEALGPGVARALGAGEGIVVQDAQLLPDLAVEARSLCDAIELRAFVLEPLVKAGRLAAFMAVHHTVPRVWTPFETALIRATTERTWEAVERTRAEEALRASEERFRALMQASAQVLYRMSPDWTEMRQLSGRGLILETERPRRTWLEAYVHPEDHRRFQAAIDEAVRTKQMLQVEHRVQRLDGTVGWTLSRAVPLFDRQGRITEWFGAGSDVTARKEAEQALRASEVRQAFLLRLNDRLRPLSDAARLQREAVCALSEHFEAQEVAYAEWRGDAERPTVVTHPIGATRARWPRRFAVYLRAVLSELAAGRAVVHHAARLVASEADIAAAFADGDRASVATVPLVKSGRLVAAVSIGYGEAHPVSDGDLALLAIVAERTWAAAERVRAEERLRTSETKYRSLFNSIQQGFVLGEVVRRGSGDVVDLRPVEVNPAFEALTGIGAAEASGLGLKALFPNVLDAWEAAYGSGRRTPPPGRFEHHVVATGRWIEADVWAAPGDRCVVLFTDVTARKEAEAEQRRAHEAEVRLREAASEANRAKDEFLALLGHELRNPLTPILATAELMRLHGRRAFAKEREVIERQGRHLARLVDDLLDVTRIARGKVKLVCKRTEVERVVSRALEMASPLFEEKRHRIVTRVEPGLCIEGDEDRLVQVVTNLLTNAAKYTEAGGQIQVTVARDGDDVVLRVRDSGSGIASALLPHVFDLFHQGPQAKDRAQGGLGLGLAIVRNLVELHGGRVAAASAGLKKGSEFTVWLPRASARRLRAAPPPTAQALPLAIRPQRILIVDDNKDIAHVLAQLLRQRGHAVEVAYGAGAGLRALRLFRPTIGLFDIGLPEMDGYELARRARADRACQGLRLIAVTGYGQAADRRRALRAGFSGHVVKPIDFERLTALIERDGGEPAGRDRQRKASALSTGRGGPRLSEPRQGA